MVYFNCQGCQETLKKPACKKHLSGRCWGAALACVDCGVTFYGDDWEKHTQCISEEKKYQGKLYQEKNDKEPKGKVKQDAWTAGLKMALEKADGRVKGYIEKLVE